MTRESLLALAAWGPLVLLWVPAFVAIRSAERGAETRPIAYSQLALAVWLGYACAAGPQTPLPVSTAVGMAATLWLAATALEPDPRRTRLTSAAGFSCLGLSLFVESRVAGPAPVGWVADWAPALCLSALLAAALAALWPTLRRGAAPRRSALLGAAAFAFPALCLAAARGAAPDAPVAASHNVAAIPTAVETALVGVDEPAARLEDEHGLRGRGRDDGPGVSRREQPAEQQRDGHEGRGEGRDRDEGLLFAMQEEGRISTLVVSTALDAQELRVLIGRLESDQHGTAPSVIFVGPEPPSKRLRDLCCDGRVWSLREPVGDPELASVARMALSEFKHGTERERPRAPVDLMVAIREPEGERSRSGVMTSLSTGGGYVSCRPSEPDAIVELEFTLEDGPVTVKARVLYVSGEDARADSGMGVALLDLDAALEARIQESVNESSASCLA